MPNRIPRIEVETGSHEQVFGILEILLARGKQGNKMGNLFSMMVTSPEVARRLGRVGEYVRYHTHVPEMCRETAILSACYQRHFMYDAKPHEEIALHRGMPSSHLEAIREGRFADLPDDLAETAQFARAVASLDVVPQDVFDKVRARFGEVGMLDLALTAAYYIVLNMMANVLTPDLDEPGEALFRPTGAP